MTKKQKKLYTYTGIGVAGLVGAYFIGKAARKKPATGGGLLEIFEDFSSNVDAALKMEPPEVEALRKQAMAASVASGILQVYAYNPATGIGFVRPVEVSSQASIADLQAWKFQQIDLYGGIAMKGKIIYEL